MAMTLDRVRREIERELRKLKDEGNDFQRYAPGLYRAIDLLAALSPAPAEAQQPRIMNLLDAVEVRLRRTYPAEPDSLTAARDQTAIKALREALAAPAEAGRPETGEQFSVMVAYGLGKGVTVTANDAELLAAIKGLIPHSPVAEVLVRKVLAAVSPQARTPQDLRQALTKAVYPVLRDYGEEWIPTSQLTTNLVEAILAVLSRPPASGPAEPTQEDAK